MERSIEQWWSHRSRQEYSTADGIGTALERYVLENFEAVLSDLSSSGPRFRRVAAASLGFSKDQRAVDPLLSSLSDNNDGVLVAALLSLGHLALEDVSVPSKPVVPFLSHRHADVRVNASRILVHTASEGDGVLFLPLTTALDDPVPAVRLHSAAALGALGDPDAIGFLLKLLKDDKALVRIRAAYALGRIGDRRAVSRLIDSLDDPDEDVSKAVFKSLCVLTSQSLPRVKLDWQNYWATQEK
jgi:HEAT repeat protein